MKLQYRDVATPWGPFRLVAADDTLVRTVLPGTDIQEVEAQLQAHYDSSWTAEPNGILQEAAVQIEDYLRGSRHEFDLPLQMEGTAFQRAVWRQLLDIPFGETRSYAELAAAIGRPGAARAIGQANRRNPLPILVPCHRVVAADGSLGGYMGAPCGPDGGLKAQLLKHEAAWML